MALATWWRGDALPPLDPLPAFRVEAAWDARRIAHVTGLPVDQVRGRLAQGHHPYLAYIAAVPVGYGWLAQREAAIGELALHFTLPPTDRYLWDFATLPAWQGYGVYPRLLQAILRQQTLPVERVWIIHAPENTPSGAGMHKAGLQPVGHLSFRPDGTVGLAARGARERAQVGAALLGVPLIETILAPCWACGGPTPTPVTHVEAAGCWPPLPPTTPLCGCAIALKPGQIKPDRDRQLSGGLLDIAQ
jgi:hypothetical protein